MGGRLSWWPLFWIALAFGPRAQAVIVSALECGREASAVLRNNLRLPVERQLFASRAL